MRRIPSLSPQQNLIVGAAVRAVADETMEDALARAIAVRAGRRPDCERLLFAIVDGLEDYKLTAPAFILRQARGCYAHRRSLDVAWLPQLRPRSVVIQEMVSETLRPTCRCISSSSYRPAHPAFIFGLTLQRLRQLGDVCCDAPDGRISELRDEIDELRDLVSRLREHAEESDACIESWKETFDMVQTESGGWTWSPFWEEHNQLIQDYNDLVRYWNNTTSTSE
jgi:hypothetical protein